MIAFVEGLVAATRESSVIVAVGGVGLEINAPKPTLDACVPGKPVRLETFLLVREDALALYGFHDADHLEMFKLLITVSGVGPRTALAALSGFTPGWLAKGILSDDTAMLSSVSGVGKKTAERIILELQNRIPPHLRGAVATARIKGDNPAFRDAVEALVALGYREGQVRSAIQTLLEADPDSSAQDLIRKGLTKLR